MYTSYTSASSRLDHRELVRTRLRQPDLAAPSQYLPHLCIRARQGDDAAAFAHRIEPHDGVCAEVRQPHLIALVDVDRVRLRSFARQRPFAPRVVSRLVTRDLAREPFAHPDAALGIGPHTARALLRGRRDEHGGVAVFDVDARDVRARERDIVHAAVGRSGDAVRTAAARCLKHRDLAARGIDAAGCGSRAKPVITAARIEGRGIEVHVRRALGRREDADLIGRGVDTHDGVEPRVRDPRSAVGADDAAVGTRGLAERDVPRASGLRIAPAESTQTLRGEPPDSYTHLTLPT